MADESTWLRETARKWRDLAEVTEGVNREKRLKFADDLDEMAKALEARHRGPDASH